MTRASLLVNDRARGVVDLLLLKRFAEETGLPATKEISAAVRDIFASRAREAIASGHPARHLPATIAAHVHWRNDYERATKSANIKIALGCAVEEVNA